MRCDDDDVTDSHGLGFHVGTFLLGISAVCYWLRGRGIQMDCDDWVGSWLLKVGGYLVDVP